MERGTATHTALLVSQGKKGAQPSEVDCPINSYARFGFLTCPAFAIEIVQISCFKQNKKGSKPPIWCSTGRRTQQGGVKTAPQIIPSFGFLLGYVRKVDLIGDAFLSCGCLSYYGPFTGGYRDDLVATWMKRVRQEGIPCSGGGGGVEGEGEEGDEGDEGGGASGFSLIDTLGDPVEIRGWQNCALPTDKVWFVTPLSTYHNQWALLH